MGWYEVISGVAIFVLTGTNIAQWVSLKSTKKEAAANAKKAAASAQGAEIQNVEAVITLWREMAEKMAADRAILADQVEELSAEVRRLKNATNRMARLLDKITPENLSETIEIIRKEIDDEYTNATHNLADLVSRVQSTTADGASASENG